MDKQLANEVRANEMLHRLAIEDACKNGLRFYDMGFAIPGSPLASFKEKLGAKLFYNYHLHAERIPLQRAAQFPRSLVRKMILAASR